MQMGQSQKLGILYFKESSIFSSLVHRHLQGRTSDPKLTSTAASSLFKPRVLLKRLGISRSSRSKSRKTEEVSSLTQKRSDLVTILTNHLPSNNSRRQGRETLQNKIQAATWTQRVQRRFSCPEQNPNMHRPSPSRSSQCLTKTENTSVDSLKRKSNSLKWWQECEE